MKNDFKWYTNMSLEGQELYDQQQQTDVIKELLNELSRQPNSQEIVQRCKEKDYQRSLIDFLNKQTGY